MNKDKRELEYPVELESQLLLRLPEEPAKLLREILQTGESLKNRLTIQIDNDMRHGEVNLDHRSMHAKIIDLPTIIESLKTIDNKSFYKTADICQMMICKDEPEQPPAEEDSQVKNKKKDSFKVDKKFLWPHGITPPTKNVRKRRFRKTLRKKCAEAPEIEKEVKRLLQADNEAVSITWEVIKEEDDHRKPEKTYTNIKHDKKPKLEHTRKRDQFLEATNKTASNEVDIFGGAVSDSDLEEDNMEMEEGHLSAYDSHQSDTSSLQGTNDIQNKNTNFSLQFNSQMFTPSTVAKLHARTQSSSDVLKTRLSSESYSDYQTQDNMNLRIEQLRSELEELKQRRQQTQQEISGMENIALRQRFQNTLHTLNQDIMYKEMEYQGLLTLQNSEDI